MIFRAGYVYLNRQVYAQIWEILNIDNVLQIMGGHLMFNGVDSFFLSFW
jgi:hypothetical protein